MRSKCVATRLAVAFLIVAQSASAAGTPGVTITLANDSPREQRARTMLDQMLAEHDVKKYVFTNRVIIEQGATNHAFPVLTMNPHVGATADSILSTFLHEQLHWHLRNQGPRMQQAVNELRRLYPRVPVGLPDAAENEYSTYAHLIDCYLEIVADREVMGGERTDAIVRAKPWYFWIYSTVLKDERQIAAIVDRYQLRVP
jgi:hypothetical protein